MPHPAMHVLVWGWLMQSFCSWHWWRANMWAKLGCPVLPFCRKNCPTPCGDVRRGSLPFSGCRPRSRRSLIWYYRSYEEAAMWSMSHRETCCWRLPIQVVASRADALSLPCGTHHCLMPFPYYCLSGLPVAAATARNQVRGLHYVPARSGVS